MTNLDGREKTQKSQNQFLRFLRFFAAIFAVVSFVGCSKSVKPDPNVLAKVGSVEIRIEDFNREMDLRLKANRTVLSKNELVQEMIQHELLVLKAKQAGLDKDPDFLRAQKNLLASRYKERDLKPQLDFPAIPAAEIEARYQQTIDKYTRPAKARLAIIYAKSDPKMSDEKRAELRQRMNEVRGKARPDSRGFGALAIEHSEDQPSRYKGGDIGWLDQGRDGYRWPKDVITAGFSLATNGTVSEVIETPVGLYLVARLDWRDGAVTPLNDVQSTIQRQLAGEKRREIEEAFLRKTREGVPVEIRPEALALARTPPIATAKRTEPEPPAFP